MWGLRWGLGKSEDPGAGWQGLRPLQHAAWLGECAAQNPATGGHTCDNCFVQRPVQGNSASPRTVSDKQIDGNALQR